MKRYTIGGKEKTDKHFCPVCKNGEVFEREYYTDPTNDKDTTRICSVCNTKYIIPKIDLGFEMEIGTTRSKRVSDVKNLKTNEITKENKVIQMIKIAEEFNSKRKEAFQPDVPDLFGNTAKADIGHIWIESQPFNTYDGEFKIKNCAKCKLGQVTYKGNTYQDKLMKLVTFLADMGIMNREKDEQANQIELDNLFEDEPLFGQSDTGLLDEPSFDIFKEPIF